MHTQTFNEQEKMLVEKILAITPVENIYRLGATLCQRHTETIFLSNTPSCKNVGHYYLLILVNKDAKYSYNDLQDRIENTCQHVVRVTAIVLSIEQFKNLVDEGHSFVEKTLNHAALLHGNHNFKAIQPTVLSGNNAEYWTEEYNQVNEFIEGANLYILRRQNKMALFMLHQAAVHALRAIFKNKSGLYMNTHNLDKLIRYCSMVCYEIPDIFSRNNDKEERLFQLLQKACINTKHKEEFMVTKNDIEIVLEKIKSLQGIMKLK